MSETKSLYENEIKELQTQVDSEDDPRIKQIMQDALDAAKHADSLVTDLEYDYHIARREAGLGWDSDAPLETRFKLILEDGVEGMNSVVDREKQLMIAKITGERIENELIRVAARVEFNKKEK